MSVRGGPTTASRSCRRRLSPSASGPTISSRREKRGLSGATPGVCPSNHGERGERAGEREREAQRRPTRCGARDARRELVAAGGRSEQPSGSAAAAALPRIVRRSRHDYSDSLLDGDQDRVALERHLVTLDALALVHRVAARGHVVLPAVPRAGDDHALELALPERPATVEAGVGGGVERAAHVE